VEILVSRRGEIRSLELKPVEQPFPVLSITTDPDASPEQVRLRRQWLFEEGQDSPA
jgi:hypothetical protein